MSNNNPNTNANNGNKVNDIAKLQNAANLLKDVISAPIQAVIVPMGRDESGLPLGLQFIGARHQDGGEAVGERLDQEVAAMMADRVVDRLEAVDVEIDDGEVTVTAGGDTFWRFVTMCTVTRAIPRNFTCFIRAITHNM